MFQKLLNRFIAKAFGSVASQVKAQRGSHSNVKAWRQWIDARFPLTSSIKAHLTEYIVPSNLNFWYYFGVFSLVVLLNQILTGVWLAMYYDPTAHGAFDSIEHIMRHVHYGWLLRYMHTTGASAFFIVLYLHMYRCVMYGSYKKPRELLWVVGMILYTIVLAEAYTGYVLPWGQMSYWATKVVISLFSVLPWIGKQLVVWLQGDYAVSGVTLHRFFAFHVSALPIVIIGFVVVHLIALHHVGSNSPEGIDSKAQLEMDIGNLAASSINGQCALGDKHRGTTAGIPFHPYFTVKDLMGLAFFLLVCAVVVFYFPTFFGHFIEPDNAITANPLQTPEHIRPVWYMSPFYAMLRAIPNKLGGVLVMAASIGLLYVLPWLDRSPVRSMRYKGALSKFALVVFVVSFLMLGYLGATAVTPIKAIMARAAMAGYFGFFLLMPLYSRLDCVREVNA